MALTPKQEKFCLVYLETGNASEAYRRAYNTKNMKPASVNRNAKAQMDNTKIASRLRELRDAAAEKVVIDRAWVLSRLVENANRAMQAEQGTDKDGNPTGDFTYQGSVANRALELVGKELGMFVDRKEVGAPGEFDALDDDELDREIEREAAKLGIQITPLDAGEGAKTKH